MLVSVIICTHNPREDYLRRTLDALRAQTLPVGDWELILVDNASNPPLAGRFDLSWHPRARCVREEKTGLTHARLKGIAEAGADLLVLVDDDNVLRPDYLANAVEIAGKHPWLGVWSGNAMPEFEVEPPPAIRPHLGCLAVTMRKQAEPTWAMVRFFIITHPFGAGMCLRRVAARHYHDCVANDPLRQALDRSGRSLSAGGDHDIVYSTMDLGLGGGIFPQLELTHLVSARRLTVDYVAGVRYGQGYGSVVLGVIHQPGFIPLIQRDRRIWWEWFKLLAKSPAERRIQLAAFKGQLAAYRDLKKLGRFQ